MFQSGRKERSQGDRAEVTKPRVGRAEGACTRDVVALPGTGGRMGHAAGK